MSIENKTDLKAGSKINLFLKVGPPMANGYHHLKSLFLPLPEPFDLLEIYPADSPGLSLTCSIPELVKNNILTKTWKLFHKSTGFGPALKIHLKKNIPIGAGLGGGSSDAASLLNWLNSKAKNRALTDRALHNLASKLGADVPFFLKNKPAWATGIGDRLSPVNLKIDRAELILICPRESVNTAWAYGAWDKWIERQNEQTLKKGTTETLTSTFEQDKDHLFGTGLFLYNDFEKVVYARHPMLYRLKLKTLSLGASACVLSGSGASMTAVSRNKKTTQSLKSYLTKISLPHYIFPI